jgi:3-hydroxyacyl-CoA dehydrogenase
VGVYLIGVGIVGREILKAHLDAGIPICVADQDESHLADSIKQLALGDDIQPDRLGQLAAMHIGGRVDTENSPGIVIESISERLAVKQSFFQSAEQLFDRDTVFCSNTSTLRISQIADRLKRPGRFCGMHFFMPVDQREAVEIVRGERSDRTTIEVCLQHVRSLEKTPIVVADGPGFIVNRLLCPYLNQALTLLGLGVSADQLERAALTYGMPMSPLELMDWIGTRTMFDAGRVFWQSFPSRFEPSPILPALVKAQRLGRACGRGCYDYRSGERSDALSTATQEICQRYRRGAVVQLSDDDVMLLLSIPMWIEATFAYREQIAASHQQFDVAMRGGLGYRSEGTWLEFFELVGSARMQDVIERYAAMTKSLRVPDDFVTALSQHSPTAALDYLAQGANQPERRAS